MLNMKLCRCCNRPLAYVIANKKYCDNCSIERQRHLKMMNTYKFRVRTLLRKQKDQIERMDLYIDKHMKLRE